MIPVLFEKVNAAEDNVAPRVFGGATTTKDSKAPKQLQSLGIDKSYFGIIELEKEQQLTRIFSFERVVPTALVEVTVTSAPAIQQGTCLPSLNQVIEGSNTSLTFSSELAPFRSNVDSMFSGLPEGTLLPSVNQVLENTSLTSSTKLAPFQSPVAGNVSLVTPNASMPEGGQTSSWRVLTQEVDVDFTHPGSRYTLEKLLKTKPTSPIGKRAPRRKNNTHRAQLNGKTKCLFIGLDGSRLTLD